MMKNEGVAGAPARRKVRWLAMAILGLIFCASSQAEETSTPSEKPQPQTTADPQLPVDHLKLLLKPLTKEELVVEADGWRDLLKASVQRIAEHRIGVKNQQEVLETNRQVVEELVSEEGDDVTTTKSEAIQEDTQYVEQAATERKQDLAETLGKLQTEKDPFVQRLNVVIDELKLKGGEVESYQKYISAQLGVAMEVTDTAAFWAVLKGWLVSEQGGQRWLWNFVRFLVIVIGFYFGASIAAGLVRHAASRVQAASLLLVDFLGKFVKQLVIIIGLIVSLAALEVNITPLLAAVGAAGFVIGFALQGTLSNCASGLLILAYRPFDVGDVIDAAGISGTVDSVSLFSTHVRTFDNKMMIVPNNDIWGGTITNATASDIRRVDMVFGISYEDDIEKAKEILESLVQQHDLVLDDPAPVVQLHELADSSVNFICRPWTKTGDYWTVHWDITRGVKESFDRSGISIPFPQRDVHLYQQES